jgi:hypothetical protein
MACCAAGACPMHKGESHGSGSSRALTQTQADSCCAASEQKNSSPSNPTFIAQISSAVLGPAIGLPAIVPAPVLSDGWRRVSPIPAPPVPRHVLLSVFLI